MSLINGKIIMLLMLVAIASWYFPWGVVLDAGIVIVYVLVKRKRVPGAATAAKAAPGQASTTDESVKLLAMAMLSDKVSASGNAAATSLGLPPAPAPRQAGKPAPAMSAADRAAKLRLFE
ncbi:MAG: hypothetical protein GYA24_20890 [Candidatus Lokiarchaeota archaeon]|nr:hypothetical protein [Candidatus Lokiarchaeota archaeon]